MVQPVQIQAGLHLMVVLNTGKKDHSAGHCPVGNLREAV